MDWKVKDFEDQDKIEDLFEEALTERDWRLRLIHVFIIQNWSDIEYNSKASHKDAWCIKRGNTKVRGAYALLDLIRRIDGTLNDFITYWDKQVDIVRRLTLRRIKAAGSKRCQDEMIRLLHLGLRGVKKGK